VTRDTSDSKTQALFDDPAPATQPTDRIPDEMEIEAFAQLIEVTVQSVRAWIGEGMPVAKHGRQGPGQGAVVRTADALVWFLREKKHPAVQRGEWDAQRTRLAAAQAEKAELDLAERRGELADLNTIAEELGKLFSVHRSQLLSVPTKLSPQLVGLTDAAKINAILRAEIESRLSEFASYKPGSSVSDPAENPNEFANTRKAHVGKPHDTGPGHDIREPHREPSSGRKRAGRRTAAVPSTDGSDDAPGDAPGARSSDRGGVSVSPAPSPRSRRKRPENSEQLK
jgi:phage terminase Nu1 subunit (DNA packaging protein)